MRRNRLFDGWLLGVALSISIGLLGYPIRRRPGFAIRFERLLVLVSATLYPVLLLWALTDVISPAYAYMGFGYTPPGSAMVSGLTLMLAIAPGWFMPLGGRRPSTIVAWILYILVYVPAQIVPIYSSGRAIESFVSFQLTLFAGFALILVFGALPAFTFPRLRLSPWIFWAGLLAFSLVVYASVIARYGVPSALPSLTDVYSVRTEFSQQSVGQGAYLTYAISWQAKVLNPLLMAYGVVKRNFALAGLGFAGQILLFALAGHKSVLFSALLVIGLLLASRQRGASTGVLLSLGASGLVIVSVLLDKMFQTNWITSLFVRRLVLVPGLLTGYYHEFFSANPLTGGFGPFTRWLVEYPYDLRVPNLIGLAYFNKATMSANANLWADGFASFGYFGVILVSVVLGLVLWTFNSLGHYRNNHIAVVLAGVVSFSLVNSSLMTSLGTHGIGLAVVLLLLFPHNSTDEEWPTQPPMNNHKWGSGRGRE